MSFLVGDVGFDPRNVLDRFGPSASVADAMVAVLSLLLQSRLTSFLRFAALAVRTISPGFLQAG